jgi:hypothetical protein
MRRHAALTDLAVEPGANPRDNEGVEVSAWRPHKRTGEWCSLPSRSSASRSPLDPVCGFPGALWRLRTSNLASAIRGCGLWTATTRARTGGDMPTEAPWRSNVARSLKHPTYAQREVSAAHTRMGAQASACLWLLWAAAAVGVHAARMRSSASPRGFQDGAFHAARFHSPQGVAATADGTTVYVAVRTSVSSGEHAGPQLSVYLGCACRLPCVGNPSSAEPPNPTGCAFVAHLGNAGWHRTRTTTPSVL